MADQISMSRVVTMSSMIVRQTLNLQRLSTAKSRAKIWKEMLCLPGVAIPE